MPIQGGLECSTFVQYDKHMDIVTFGALSDCEHTTAEYLDLNSFDENFAVLRQVLSQL